jgi:hypothetical protein
MQLRGELREELSAQSACSRPERPQWSEMGRCECSEKPCWRTMMRINLCTVCRPIFAIRKIEDAAGAVLRIALRGRRT